jgi:hypothetical protein
MATHPVISTEGRHITAHKLDVFSWSFFFIWIGIALLSRFSWGVGLLGVGIIILGKQATRKYMAFGFETFEVVCGALFVLGDVWALLSVPIGLVPVFALRRVWRSCCLRSSAKQRTSWARAFVGPHRPG